MWLTCRKGMVQPSIGFVFYSPFDEGSCWMFAMEL